MGPIDSIPVTPSLYEKGDVFSPIEPRADGHICHGSTLTTFDGLLKERYYDSSIVERLTYPDNVLLAMLEKRGDTGMVGDVMPVPIISALPQGIGGVFSTAQTNAAATGGTVRTAKWAITAGDYYGVVHIGDKLLEASRSNAGAFLEDKRLEIDGLYEQAGESLSIYSWGNGGQYIGQVASISGNDIALVEAADAQNFEVGMLIDASANDGSDTAHTLRANTGCTVTNINRATSAQTLSTVAAITGLAINDYLFRSGDFFGNVGTTVLKGVQAFMPATDALVNATLWGITGTTRLTDVQRYGGCRVDPTLTAGRNYEERIKILLAQMTGRFKAKMPTAGFLNPEEFQVLETLMTSRGQRSLKDDSTKFGFAKIDITTGGGTVPIYTDRHCPKGHFVALRMENWWLSSMGELLHPQKGDGLDMLRRATSTDYEFRLLGYPLLACNAPKNNGRVALT